MEHAVMSGLVSQIIDGSGLSTKDVAKRAGLSRTTLYRAQSGSADPRISSLREIAIACGLDIEIKTLPLSDPGAMAGARLLLEEGYVPADADEALAWAQRIERVAGPDPVAEMVHAGECADLYRRRVGAWFHTGPLTPIRLASAGDGAKAPWGLSGAPLVSSSGVLVLHTGDARLASALLSESAPVARANDQVTAVVVQADSATFHGSWTRGGVNLVSPTQIMLDNISLGGNQRQAAIDEIKEWRDGSTR